MSFMLTASGAEYHFTGPRVATGRPVSVDDIAHHLSQLNRYTGAARRPYSVAEHALLTADIAEWHGETPIVQLCTLHHDSHEMVTADLNSPAKHAVDAISGNAYAWSLFEHEHAEHFRRALSLHTTFVSARARIKHYDLIALATERRDLTPYNADRHGPWFVLRDGQPDAIEPTLIDLNTEERKRRSWEDWRGLFLARHEQLTAEILRQVDVLLHGAPSA